MSCSDILRRMGNKRSGPSVTIVGAGSLASALVKLLPKAGFPVKEVVIREGSARRVAAAKLARASGARLCSPATANWSSKIVWLAVSDRSIATFAESIAESAKWKGKIVFHSSGALSSSELEALRRKGAYTASLHPMMTFVPSAIPSMKDVVWGMEGDRQAITVARKLVQCLKGIPIEIDAERKPLYHAFGAFLSPLLVVHLVTASRLALASGIPRKNLVSVMRPIVFQTLENYFDSLSTGGEAGQAFSGPLIRGDVATIEGHIRALKIDPAVRDLYVALISAALHTDLPVKDRSAIKTMLLEI